MSKTWSIIVGSIGLGLVAATTIPAFLTIYKKLWPQKGNGSRISHKLYEDGDGIATEKSQKEYSTIIPRTIALVGSIIGFLLSVAASVISTVQPDRALSIENWITFGSWVGNYMFLLKDCC